MHIPGTKYIEKKNGEKEQCCIVLRFSNANPSRITLAKADNYVICGVGWYVWRPGGGVDGEKHVA